MPAQPSHVVDRIEIRAAKLAERERIAQSAWADVHDTIKAQDEKTERLRALRLAQQADKA